MNETTTTYTRVIPRDFFNESKLLKCMGQLALKVLDRMPPNGKTIEIEETGEPFDIQLTDDGMMFVSNYPIKVNGQEVTFATRYNSKAPYPFYAIVDYEEYLVFDENGNFSDEFINAPI